MITPATYTEDAVNQLNQQGVDVVNPTILYQQRNLARRQYAGEFPWRWATLHTTLTFVLDAPTGLYAASLPSGRDDRFPVTVSSIIGSAPKNWTETDYASLFLTSTIPNYYLDTANSRILSNCGAVTAYLEYQKEIVDLPVNTTQDSTAEPFPNATAITFLLASYYVLSTRQKTGTASFFKDQYDAQLLDDVDKETAKIGVIDLNLPVTGRR